MRGRWIGSVLGLVFALAASACNPSEVEFVVLEVQRAGDGAGVVRSRLVDGIDCGEDCVEAYARSAAFQLTLEVVVELGSYFVGWSGDCAGAELRCTVTMDAARTVEARVDRIEERALTVRVVGDGRVDSMPGGIECGLDCYQVFRSPTEVELVKKAEPGSLFAGWSGDCAGRGPCNLTMTSTRHVEAHFDHEPVELVVIVDGPGTVTSSPSGVDCGTRCVALFGVGAEVTLQATADQHAAFTGWAAAECEGTAPCELLIVGSSTVTARFEAVRAEVAVSKRGDGGGTVVSLPGGIDCGWTCSGGFVTGTMVRLEAAAEPGSVFSGWSGACAGNQACELTVDGRQDVVATFNTAAELNVTFDGDGFGAVVSDPVGVDCVADCVGAFPVMSGVTLTATPAVGSTFAGWSGVCIGTGPCQLWMDDARAVTARFDPVPRLVTAGLAGHGAGRIVSTPPGLDCGAVCQHPFPNGGMLTLTAVPAAGSRFVAWTGACAGAGEVCSVDLQGPTMAIAEFETHYVLLAAGEFSMGSEPGEPGRGADEGPVHTVRHSADLWVKETEVTQAEWLRLRTDLPSFFTGCGVGCPVEQATFDDAVAYVNTLSAFEGLQVCYEGGTGAWTLIGLDCTGYRLPTEAEWERFARASSTAPFSNGPITHAAADCSVADTNLDAIGWYCHNTQTSNGPQAVGGKLPNALGLYDVHGNVAEWTDDWYDAAAYVAGAPVIDPQGPATGVERVVRGGAFDDLPRHCRAAARLGVDPASQSSSIGFRPVRSGN